MRGCGKCARECPASVIKIREVEAWKKHWYDYLWIASLLYLLLGFFNILFAWLGLLCFFIPLIISVVSGTKSYCNRYCGPGPAVWAAGRALRAVPQERHPQMDEKQGVPIRISLPFSSPCSF